MRYLPFLTLSRTLVCYLIELIFQIKNFSLEKAKMGTEQWRNAQESLLSLEKRNVASVESIVR